MLSALLAREVVELKCRATERRHELTTSVLVLRLDFAATVRLEDGSQKLVLIEIQKARMPLDVLRFRRYLAAQYAEKSNVFTDGQGTTRPLPIVTIYFLGEGLERTSAAVLRVNRQYLDAATGEQIPLSEPFVEALTHDCIVIQIDRLRGRRRTDLERLLMVFDQGLAQPGNPQFLELVEEDYPEPCLEVFRRLMRAIAEKGVRDGMDVEDEFLASMLDKDRCLAEKDKALEEAAQDLERKDRALEEKDKTLEEQNRALEEKDRALADKERQIEELRPRPGPA